MRIASIKRQFQLIKTVNEPIIALSLLLGGKVVYISTVNNSPLHTTASTCIPIEIITTQGLYFGFLLLKALESVDVVCVYKNASRMSLGNSKRDVVIMTV
jgi:hypothetical protein